MFKASNSFARALSSDRSARQRGFTLMELMIVVTLVALVLGLAIPNFRDFIRNSRVTSAANDLLAALNQARSEAVKRQLPVAICPTSDPQTASPSCTTGWTQGASSAWIVWVDADDDWSPDNTAAEPVLLRHSSLDSSLRMLSNNSGRVKYLFSGFASPPSGGFTNTTAIAICDERGRKITTGGNSAARALLITATGRARVTRMNTEISAITGINGVCPP